MKVLAIILLSQLAFAWEAKKISGSVYVVMEDKRFLISEGQKLENGALVITESGARAQLSEGQSLLNLGGNTKLKLPSAGSNGAPSPIELLYGKARAQVGKSEAPNFKIQLPTVVAGVRGTDFFVSTNESGDILCTLEGLVEATTNGEKFEIPVGKGLRLAPGTRPQLRANSQSLVLQWISETSVDESENTILRAYTTERPQYEVAPKVWVGGTEWFHYCHSFNLDYDTANDDRDLACTRFYFSPFVQVGDKFSLFVRPAVIGSYWNMDRSIDNFPVYSGESQTTVTIAEGYGQVSDHRFNLKVGYQAIEWNDGVILSKQEWSQEPVTHLAARAIVDLEKLSLEFVSSQRPTDLRVLDGHTHITLLGGRVLFPEPWGNLFFIETDFGMFDQGTSVYTMGHRIQNAGYFDEARYGDWDHRISLIYQRHMTHAMMGRPADPVEGNMIDLEFGVFAEGRPARLSLRYINASGNFIPIFEDYYTMGLSGLIRRNNVEQYRGKLEMQFSDNHLITSELMMSKEVTASGFVRQTASQSSGEPLGTELDVVYLWKPTFKVDAYFGGWAFFPPPLRVRDSARGFMARVVHRF